MGTRVSRILLVGLAATLALWVLRILSSAGQLLLLLTVEMSQPIAYARWVLFTSLLFALGYYGQGLAESHAGPGESLLAIMLACALFASLILLAGAAYGSSLLSSAPYAAAAFGAAVRYVRDQRRPAAA